MKTIQLTVIAGAMFLAGCEAQIIDDNTDSRFDTPSASGSFASVSNGSSGGIFVNGQGFAFEAGASNDTGLIAVSGLLPSTTVSAPPVSGSAVYNGRYELVRVSSFSLNYDTNEISGFALQDSGDISLTANFDSSKLTGSSGDLSVNGDINGVNLDGSVRYKDVRGTLDGLIGSDKAVGVFHGNDSDEIYAGGFYVIP